MGVRSQIFDAFCAKLEAIPWVNTVAWDKVRIVASDIQAHEVPLIQVYALRGQSIHVGQKIQCNLQIFVELVLRQSDNQAVDQKQLFDYLEDIEQAIGANPNLGVPGMVHVKLLGDEIDLHTIDPFFYGRIAFEAIYHKNYSNNC